MASLARNSGVKVAIIIIILVIDNVLHGSYSPYFQPLKTRSGGAAAVEFRPERGRGAVLVQVLDWWSFNGFR
jgi:hypothetical protein